MMSIQALQDRRVAICEELVAMRSMRPGNVNEQYVKTRRSGKVLTRGPYPVLCWREGKKVFSERLTSPEQLAQAKQDVRNHKRFKELCKELEALTRGLGELERDEGTAKERLKKGLKSPSGKAKKSRG